MSGPGARKHVPERLCVGCGLRSPKQDMLRIVVDKAGNLVVSRHQRGRGAYLHRDPSCWRAFSAHKGLIRSLRQRLERSVREALVQRLAGAAKQQ